MAEQLYDIAAALLADGGESFVHLDAPAQIAGSIQGPHRDALRPWLATLRELTRVRDASGGTPPPQTPAGGGIGATGGGLPGHPARPRWGLLVARPSWVPLNRLAWHHQARGLPVPCRLATGAHPGLLHDSGPLAASRTATPSAPPTKGRRRSGPTTPQLVLSPDQEEHLRAAWQVDAIRTTDVLDLHAGPSPTPARHPPSQLRNGDSRTHRGWSAWSARQTPISPSATRNACQGPEAVIRVAACARVIVKALRDGEKPRPAAPSPPQRQR